MARDSALVRVRALVQELAPVRAQVPVPERAQVPEPGLEMGTVSQREPSGRVRRFHKLLLRGPQPPEIPLKAKSVERWTK
jgi:hypothetical protein